MLTSSSPTTRTGMETDRLGVGNVPRVTEWAQPSGGVGEKRRPPFGEASG